MKELNYKIGEFSRWSQRCWLSSFDGCEEIASLSIFSNTPISTTHHRSIPLNLFYFSIKFHWQHHYAHVIRFHVELSLLLIASNVQVPSLFQCFPCFPFCIICFSTQTKSWRFCFHLLLNSSPSSIAASCFMCAQQQLCIAFHFKLPSPPSDRPFRCMRRRGEARKQETRWNGREPWITMEHVAWTFSSCILVERTPSRPVQHRRCLVVCLFLSLCFCCCPS